MDRGDRVAGGEVWKGRCGSGQGTAAKSGSRLRTVAVSVYAVVALVGLPGIASASTPAIALKDTSNLVGSLSGTPYALGLVKTAPVTASATMVTRLRVAAASLPSSVDLTPHAMPVGNQGQVGSCAAWSTDYGALGYWENKQDISGGGLEPMYTYSQLDGGQDDGSTIDGNLEIDEQQGIDAQSDYWQGNFDYSDTPTAAETANAVNWKLTSYTDLTTQQSATATVSQDSIEQALADGDPVVIGIPVYENFEDVGAADDGLYSGISGDFLGNHAIVALGYNSTGLRIENSWATSWGDNGYATLAWSFVNGYVFQATEVGPLLAGQPANTSLPTVTGSIEQGAVLSASSGSWSPAATSYSYQWQSAAPNSSDWTAISGATSSTYTVAAGEVANSIRVLVSARNATGSGVAASLPAGGSTPSSGVPVSTVAPTISGSLRKGQTLTVTTGTWSPAATTYTYAWQRSTTGGNTWSAISGATNQSYAAVTADINATLRVAVTATNSSGSTVAYSATAGPISNAPFSIVAPVASGTAQEGKTLTTGTGAWTPSASSYAYQWQSSTDGGDTWTAIPGATTKKYVLASSDVGNQVRAQVTAINSYGQCATDTTAIGPVASDAPDNSTLPAISGTVRQAQTLTAKPGTWSPAAKSYSYQWQISRDSGTAWSPISGATSAKYVPAVADLAATLRVVVTATNQYGQASASSPGAGPVASDAPANTKAPTISGTATRASTLTAKPGTWSPAAKSYTYQWQSSSNGASSWSAISGATSPTYVLAGTDEGNELEVVVTATNTYGQATATSAATAAVAASPATLVKAPKLTGSASLGSVLSVSQGTWKGAGNSYTYQWQQDAAGGWVNITAASAQKYTPAQTDLGLALRVIVTATNPDGNVSDTAGPTAVVASPAVGVAQPRNRVE